MIVLDPTLLLGLALLTSIFVGINIGGSSTGVAFGPSVGSKLISKKSAGLLMTVFALIGGWTVGRNVIETMGGQIIPSSQFTLTASVIILFFIGASLLISNLSGVPASTSMTAVGAIAGLGMATNTLNWEVMGRILSWWLVAPAVAFLAGGAVGRYLYVHLDQIFKIKQSDGPLLTLRKSIFPVRRGENTSFYEVFTSSLVVIIACYMAFSAGASNVANAVAPLVGSGVVDIGPGILIGVAAMSFGGFTIARKTLDTVGDGLTELPLMAALIVSIISASIITVLSSMGIPASLAISATMCITGLGWGRASRTVKIRQTLDGLPKMSASSLKTGKTGSIGDENAEELMESELFNPDIIKHVVTLWILSPSLSAALSYTVFMFVK